MTDPAIKETVSDKPGRGRPRLVSDESEKNYRWLGLAPSGGYSRRTLHNVKYRLAAATAIGGGHEPAFKWLFDAEREGKRQWRPTILTELGRLQDPETIRAAAARVCELKPSSIDAVAMIRRFRLGRFPPGDALQLAREIGAGIDAYRASHQATDEQVTEALRLVADAVAEVGADRGLPVDAGERTQSDEA